MAGVVRQLTREGARLFAELGKLEKAGVRVGVLSGETTSEGASLAEILLFNEFGTSQIPERPIMRRAREWWREEKLVELMIRDVFAGMSADQALKRASQRAVAIVKELFVEEEFAANAASTIARKGSSRPLIDTGRLRQAIDGEVVRDVTRFEDDEVI